MRLFMHTQRVFLVRQLLRLNHGRTSCSGDFPECKICRLCRWAAPWMGGRERVEKSAENHPRGAGTIEAWPMVSRSLNTASAKREARPRAHGAAAARAGRQFKFDWGGPWPIENPGSLTMVGCTWESLRSSTGMRGANP